MVTKTVPIHVRGVPPRTVASILRLDGGTLKRLGNWILRRAKSLEAKKLDIEGQQYLNVKRVGPVSKELREVQCGKGRCQCMHGGDKHGPYYYATWIEVVDGKRKKRTLYMGKSWLPHKIKHLLSS